MFLHAEIQDCSERPCVNGGVCNNVDNGYVCDCTDTGFEGKHCEISKLNCDFILVKIGTNGTFMRRAVFSLRSVFSFQ